MPIMYRGLLSPTLQLIRLTNSDPVRYKLNDVRVRYNEMQIFISPFIVPHFSLASKRIQNKVFKLLSKGKSLRILFPPFIFAHSVALQCDHNWQYRNRTPKHTHLRRIRSAYTTEGAILHAPSSISLFPLCYARVHSLPNAYQSFTTMSFCYYTHRPNIKFLFLFSCPLSVYFLCF